MKASDMELALLQLFNPRKDLLVPNVSWGLLGHEADLLSLARSGYATEVEIKVSLADLKADLKKKHNHADNLVKYLYFAIPESLLPHIEHIPAHAGVIIVRASVDRKHPRRPGGKPYASKHDGYTVARYVRAAAENPKARKFTPAERYQMARLGALRIWGLKRKLREAKTRIQKNQ